MPPSTAGTRLVSCPNSRPSNTAPTAITPRVTIDDVPAPAMTAGIVNTPVPMMLPITSAVADGSPNACARRPIGDSESPVPGRNPEPRTSTDVAIEALLLTRGEPPREDSVGLLGH